MRHFAIAISLLIVATVSAVAQDLTWSVGLSTVFDNREGDARYSDARTEFLTKLSPEIGLAFEGGTHRVSGGVTWLQPIGNGWNDYKLCPTLYYRYEQPTLRFSFGMFPRTQLMETAPLWLLSDSLRRYEPNVRGLAIQHVKPNGYAELVLDWRQLQSATKREAFNVNFNTRWRPLGNAFVVGGHAQLNHLAKQKNAPADQCVNDDISLHAFVGADLSHRTLLDSLTFDVGGVMQLERARSDNQWRRPGGVMINALAEWHRVGVKETFYAGGNLFPLYGQYGPLLNMGDPYFQSKVYSRTDVYARFISNRYVDLEASLNFHVAKQAFGFWQQLTLRFYFDGEMRKK